MDYASLENMLALWEESTRGKSGNLATNDYLPPEIKRRLLAENLSLITDLKFEEVSFPPLRQELNSIEGMSILSGLQRIGKEENVTVYRAIRFPTVLRMWKAVHELGLSLPNYEQERILLMYGDAEYTQKRAEIQKDCRFSTQPQERVVSGVPVFSLVNDALQIHRAYRAEKDRVLIAVIHLPHGSLKHGDIRLVANTAIDLDYNNDDRDVRLTEFEKKEGRYVLDYRALRVRGIDLHEMFVQGLPYNLAGHTSLGIEQRFFLLDIYQVDSRDKRMRNLDTSILKEHEYFLHGIFGDQNVFGRGATRYLPFRCHEVRAKKR